MYVRLKYKAVNHFLLPESIRPGKYKKELWRKGILPMKFSDIVNIEELASICVSFSELVGVATAILDVDGTILVSSGWFDICTRFHRINPETSLRCLESDTVIANGLRLGQQYNLYKCRNGLVDVAVPIVINGEHVANVFAGQFFLTEPDIDFFIHQAEEFGFDKTEYLEALCKNSGFY